jgi:hypothetical protein
MLTGINFSPPLYFLFNFCLQLVLPTSIEQLRIQSLVFIIIGIVISFLISRKVFGATAAFFATILVASQSNLLLSQAQEARHYAMFFASGAWVLLMQSIKKEYSKKHLLLTFLAHLCLCQIHYLGIIFSGLAGLSHLITNGSKKILYRMPKSILVAWLVSLPIYTLLLCKQSSHLGNWPKPNGLTNLLATYNDSLSFISVIVPMVGFLMILTPKDKDQASTKDTTTNNATLIITSVHWLLAPTLFWLMSHTSELNLFVDRYFIPKEVAVILLTTWLLHIIIIRIQKPSSTNILKYSTACICIAFILVTTKRASFGLRKETNYHHSLIIEELYPKSEKPIIIEGDPKYYPNAYLGKNKYTFLIKDKELANCYRKFSSKINICFK